MFLNTTSIPPTTASFPEPQPVPHLALGAIASPEMPQASTIEAIEVNSDYAQERATVEFRKDKLKPTKRGNPCPICSDITGKCREGESLHLCMETLDGHATPSGFKFVGQSKNGMWGLFIEEDGHQRSEREREQWQRERAARQRKQALEAERRNAASMPAIERDRHYRTLLEQLTLNATDCADLTRRGLSDQQIEAGGYKSVEQWQRLSSPLPNTLPGVSLDGRSLNTQAGYLTPIFDKDGLIVGCQTRARGGSKGDRYRWLSSRTKKQPNGPQVNLPNGELPLMVARPVDGVTRPGIGITEGIIKPFIAAQTLNQVVIGAVGRLFASSPETLKTTLEQLSAELGTKQIDFYPDAGSPSDPHTLRQYRAAITLMQQWGYQVQIAWWGQLDKDGSDIDELDDVGAIAYLTVAEFEALVPHQPQVNRDAIASSEQARLEQFKAQTERIQADFNALRLEPTVLSREFIQPGDVRLPERSGIILIDAGTGMRKTSVALKGLAVEHRQQHPDAIAASFVPRNHLGIQAGEVLGMPHHSQAPDHLPDRFTMCVESIGRVRAPQHLPEAPPLIVFDEFSQTVKQLLDGRTSGQNHAYNLAALANLCRYANAQGGWIVVSEDHITNLELDFLTQISGLAVVANYKFKKENVIPRSYTLHKKKVATTQEILERLANGENVCIASDSTKWLREIERLAIAAGLAPKDAVIIDSSTSSEPWAQAIAAAPDQFIQQAKPRLFGWSPSFGSGVSIEDQGHHFSSLAFCLVHLESRDAKQLLERLRSDVPRFGYVKEHASSSDDLFSNCRPDAILRNHHRNVDDTKALIHFAGYLADRQPVDADGNPLDVAYYMQKMLEGRDDPNTSYGFYLSHWAKYKARETYSKLNLRSEIIAIWEGKGHQVTIADSTPDKKLTAAQKEARAALDHEEATLFSALDTSIISLSDAHQIAQGINSSHPERQLAKKKILQDKLPGVNLDDAQFALKAVVKDSGRFLKVTEELWLMQNPEAAKSIDRWSLMGALTQAAKRKQMLWTPGITLRAARANLLSSAPFDPFLSGQVRTWNNNTPAAIALHQWGVFHQHKLKRLAGLTIKTEHDPVKTVNKLLRKIGFEIEQGKFEGRSRKVPGSGFRNYSISNFEDADRDAILQALTERFLNRLQSKDEGEIAQREITTHSSNNFPKSYDLTLAHLNNSDSLVDIKAMWEELKTTPEGRAVMRTTFPSPVLWEAIAS